jgi:hypothetical protein
MILKKFSASLIGHLHSDNYELKQCNSSVILTIKNYNSNKKGMGLSFHIDAFDIE